MRLFKVTLAKVFIYVIVSIEGMEQKMVID